jgi:hypothetical protein
MSRWVVGCVCSEQHGKAHLLTKMCAVTLAVVKAGGDARRRTVARRRGSCCAPGVRGQATTAHMSDGRVYTVFNIAWGYDDEDESAHITSNVSPRVTGEVGDFFVTREVAGLETRRSRGG